MINNRQEDLMRVFDKSWKANHNDVAKRGRERERKFMDKMFGINRGSTRTNTMSPGQSVQNLHNNINNAFSGQRIAKINNILKKWK